MNKEDLRNLFLYGGLTKAEYESIEEKRTAENVEIFKAVSAVASVYFVALFVMALFNDAVSKNLKVYVVMVIVSLLTFVTFSFSKEKLNSQTGPTVIYILLVTIFVFSIIIGAGVTTNYLAVTFPALLIAVPLFTVDRPYRLHILTFCVTIGFIVTAIFNKRGGTLKMDICNAVCFFVLAQVIIIYTCRTKMRASLMLYRVEGLSNVDELTGFLNRRSFENDCDKYTDGELPSDLVVVSVDVNGLKDVNDKLGHIAGDELICAAAECLKSCFGGYGRIYRTGGDEFMGLLNIDSERFELLMKNFETTTQRYKGEYITGVSASYGYCYANEAENISVDELRKISDKRMYDAKAAYYSRKGVDRRGQRDAFNALCASYVKILKINLSDDSYQVVSARPETEVSERNYSKESISQYLRDIALDGNVHPDDLEEFIRLSSVKYMCEYFDEHDEPLSIFYKRKFDKDFNQSIMQVIPTSDYTKENRTAFLYVKDIGRK